MHRVSSEEVFRDAPGGLRLLFLGGGVVFLVVDFEVVSEFEGGCLIAATIAVVGGGEDGHALVLVGVAVAFHHQLMRPANRFKVVLPQEFLADVLAPAVSSSSGRGAESSLSLISGVGPEEVAEGAIMRDILEAIDVPELIKGLDLRGQSTMQTEDLIFDFRCDWEALEDISEHLPDEVGAVFPEALVIEAVELVYLTVLVVAAEDGDAGAVLDLEEEDVEEGLHAVEAAVHVVPHEEVVRVRQLPADLEDLQQVEELTVGVPAYRHWRTDVDQVRLLAQDLLGFLADGFDLALGNDGETFEAGEVFVDVLHIENVIKQKTDFYFNSGIDTGSRGQKGREYSWLGKGVRAWEWWDWWPNRGTRNFFHVIAKLCLWMVLNLIYIATFNMMRMCKYLARIVMQHQIQIKELQRDSYHNSITLSKQSIESCISSQCNHTKEHGVNSCPIRVASYGQAPTYSVNARGVSVRQLFDW